MEKKKIYLVQVRIDWHNEDPTVINKAYIKATDAKNALEREYNKVKKYITNNLEREIAWENDYSAWENNFSFETWANDYVCGWIDKIWLMY